MEDPLAESDFTQVHVIDGNVYTSPDDFDNLLSIAIRTIIDALTILRSATLQEVDTDSIGNWRSPGPTIDPSPLLRASLQLATINAIENLDRLNIDQATDVDNRS